MNADAPYKCFLEAVPKDVCSWISEEVNFAYEFRCGRVGQHAPGRLDEHVRNHTVTFLQDDAWQNGILQHFIRQANEELWRLDVLGFQTAQYSKYMSEEFFDWHKDEHGQPYDDPRRGWYGINRKITAILTVKQGNAAGTGVSLLGRWGGEVHPPGADIVGSVLVFPSTHLHRATCAKGDTRESLTVWAVGPQLR